MPMETFADFLNKVVAAFAGNDGVYALSLMNVPHDSDRMLEQISEAGARSDS